MTALIVGVHFFALARLFHVLVYVLTGALLSVLAITLPLVAVCWRGNNACPLDDAPLPHTVRVESDEQKNGSELSTVGFPSLRACALV